MLAIVLADAVLEKFGGDSVTELRRAFDGYLAQLAARHAALGSAEERAAHE
jgi:chorismate synthase